MSLAALAAMTIKLVPEDSPWAVLPLAERVSRERGLVLLTQAELEQLKQEIERLNDASATTEE